MEEKPTFFSRILGIHSTTWTSESGDQSCNELEDGTPSPIFTPYYVDLNPPAGQRPEFMYLYPSREESPVVDSFGHIGRSVILGAGIGGLSGLYQCIQDSKHQPVFKIRRTQLINYAIKRGSASGSALGVITLMFCGFYDCFTRIRKVQDDLNTIGAATTTGLLYKSTAGLKKCAMGGVFGAGLAFAFLSW